jgi:deoxyribonuclease V
LVTVGDRGLAIGFRYDEGPGQGAHTGAGKWRWPASAEALAEEQVELAAAADSAFESDPWRWPLNGQSPPLLGGCFVAFAVGEAGPGRAGDRAWAAVVTIYAATGRSSQTDEEVVIAGVAPADYEPGFLAMREGPILGEAVESLGRRPDVLLVDATGRDHPRRAGLALHLGAHAEIPTVGVTRRPLYATGPLPAFERGASSPLTLAGEDVARWVRTRSGARPVVAHAGWRTDAATAAEVVLAASTSAARAPIPLREARRVARVSRAESAPTR